MTELRRSYPYPQQLLLGGVYDLTEGAGGTIQKLPEEGAILGEREITARKASFVFTVRYRKLLYFANWHISACTRIIPSR